jgi:hypothetical protein
MAMKGSGNDEAGMMQIHTIYSMSNSPYQDWQADLLDWSFVRSGQPGSLIRLCSADSHFPERPHSRSTVGETLLTPNYAQFDWPYCRFWRFNIPIFPFRRKIEWPVMNKPGALKYLFENRVFDDEDTLIFLDPDMVFAKPWIPRLDRGNVCGQKWFGYTRSYCEQSSIHPEFCPETQDECIMYPYAIRAGDLKGVLTDIEHFSREGYKKATRDNVGGSWMSDMPAFQTAMTKHGLVMQPHENVGLCNNWENNDDPDAPILHYCQPMLDDQGNQFWRKWDYVPWEMPPCPSLATNRVDREVLHMLSLKVREAQAAS